MKLNVDFSKLHTAASKMAGEKSFTRKEAYEAGMSCAIEGPSSENCHFSIFENEDLKHAWEEGLSDGESSAE